MNENFENFANSLPIIGSRVSHLETTTSTMDIAWALATEGAPDGTVVIADHQSAGRGRYDRSWVSKQAEDILCSVLLRPRVALAGELLMLAALAVANVAEDLGVDVGIKWPNDVQIEGKKLAGVIAESKTGPELTVGDGAIGSGSSEASVDRITAVIGIGMNINFDPESSTGMAPNSTSLASELGRQLDRREVFEMLMQSLDNHYSAITAGGTVLPEWRERLTTLGKQVTVVSGKTGGSSEELSGIAHDVDSAGRLIVRDESGRDWPVAAGEVTVKDIS
ncbi:MAG: biotin--[acetyl-CoA-carboxylase] ligase [Chloroflexi bacterium]|mgnify:CR=1|jgi:BirA family transcriptional regulator, biotin operon repressor / biotin---[acetyl-CoA-carboxylase] ligase|nr:biotin--[acetyl-CoA-carboxylase] ligase [Chloroflexota bacterium]MBT5626854.1 biotin--[acetyl-CoA-carboxylase] ligase [Chloroflexota bacterium]